MGKILKIACIDPREWYSPCLLKALNSLCSNYKTYIYLHNRNKDRSKERNSRAQSSEFTVSYVWSTYTYPFDIFKKAISDKVDVVHIQWELNTFGSFYASLLLPLLLLFLRISKIKCIVTIHSIIPRYSFGLKLPGFTFPKASKIFVESVFILLYRFVLMLSNAVIVHGDSMKRLLVLDYKSKPSQIFVIPYGIPSIGSSSKLTNQFGECLLDKPEVILAFGTISPRKGLDTLIKAFQTLSIDHPSWTLVIAGDVPSYYNSYYCRLKELASTLIKEKRVLFLGKFTPADINGLVAASRVIVFPYVYNFGASSTLTFALQHRKVVVISALNFAKDLLTDGENAIIIQPKSPDLLAKAIERAMSDDNLKSKIQKGIDTLLEKSSWDFVANENLKVYRSLI